MCTPWTVTRLLKKECASCFLACRISLDEEPVDDHRSCVTTATPKLPMRNMAIGIHDHGHCRRNERVRSYVLPPPHYNKLEQPVRRQPSHDPKTVKETSTTSTSTSVSTSTSRKVRNQSSDAESSCLHFADEDQDFIVFCFKEDGAFDVVKNVQAEGHSSMDSTSSKNSRQINPKNNDEQNTKRAEKTSNEERMAEKAYDFSFYPTNDGKYTIFDQKNEGEEEKNIYLDATENEVSIESSDSNQSACSASSFAFPVLRVEWTGSPVQMPKPERLDLRRPKARCVGLQFQCCRF